MSPRSSSALGALRALLARPLLGVAVVATLVRLLYLVAHARSALFVVPILDSRLYELSARALAAGELPAALGGGFRSLVYPLLLAPLYRLFGDGGIVVAQLLQHAAGVATAVGVATLAHRIFGGAAAAWGGGLAYALAGPPLVHEGELVVEPLFCALVAAFLLLAGRAGEAPNSRPALGAGALLGLAAQLRPNALLLLAVLPVAWARAGAPEARRRLALAAAVVAAVTLAAAAVQTPFTGSFRLLPAAGGVNLFLGNARGADGLVPRQPFEVSYGDEYRDSVEAFAAESQRSAGLPPGTDASGYWLRRTAAELAADPLGRLRLLGRKAWALLWNGEVPNLLAYDFLAREEVPWLRWLPGRFGPIFALALVGLVASPASPARTWSLAFAATHAVGVVLFFVADRYRLPLYVPLCAFAGGGLAALGAALRKGRAARGARALALLAVGLLVSCVDWTGAARDLPGPERDLYFRSIARFESGDAHGALADARRAATLAAPDPHLLAHLGNVALSLDRLDLAEGALERAVDLAPRSPRALNSLGIARERRGRPEAAYRLYLRALAAAPDYTPAALHAAWIEVRAGAGEKAAARASALPPSARRDVLRLVLEAELARRSGDATAAAEHLRAAAQLSPEVTRRLGEELAAGLSPGVLDAAAPESTGEAPAHPL